MTKKLRVYLLILLTAVCAACAACGIAGCKIGRPGRAEVLAGYNAHVTYYSNGGLFNGSTTITVRELYFKNDPSSKNYNASGVPFFDITSNSEGMNVKQKGYDLVGWFIPKTYESGEHNGEIMYTYTYTENGEEKTVPAYPVYEVDGEGNYVLDGNGNKRNVTDTVADRPVFKIDGSDEQILESKIRVVASEEQLDSSRRVADDENLIVCAVWSPSLKIQYKLVCEEGKTYSYTNSETDETVTYKNGDVLMESNFGDGSTATPSSMSPLNLSGATFVRTCSDETVQTPASSIVRPEVIDPENPVVYVYSHYIDGEGWTIVGNDASAVASMFNGLTNAANKYYLTENVDCSGQRFSLSDSGMTASATINGNGKTLSNIAFSISSAANRASFSIFGNIGASFKVSNLKIENVTIDITGRGQLTLYAICHSANASAQFTDFEISGITATVGIPKNSYVTNAQNGDRSNWLCGGGASDEEVLSSLDGLKITGETTLTINQ